MAWSASNSRYVDNTWPYATPFVSIIQPALDRTTRLTLSFTLKAAVKREKAVQAIAVQRECTNCVVTFWAMSQF